ncbi:MAG TPA: efflux RND transporter permease subunit [Methylocella sp.]|nr:efflux RND transporter permease subunit [Methylocella sp.]
MNISAPFIRRPVATTLLTLAIVYGGILAYFKLPLSAMPEIHFPLIDVEASMPGAGGHALRAAWMLHQGSAIPVARAWNPVTCDRWLRGMRRKLASIWKTGGKLYNKSRALPVRPGRRGAGGHLDRAMAPH